MEPEHRGPASISKAAAHCPGRPCAKPHPAKTTRKSASVPGERRATDSRNTHRPSPGTGNKADTSIRPAAGQSQTECDPENEERAPSTNKVGAPVLKPAR